MTANTEKATVSLLQTISPFEGDLFISFKSRLGYGRAEVILGAIGRKSAEPVMCVGDSLQYQGRSGTRYEVRVLGFDKYEEEITFLVAPVDTNEQTA